MPAYRYTALDRAGQPLHGTMEAPTQAAAIAAIQRQGHIPMRAELAGRDGFWRDFAPIDFFAARPLSQQNVSDFTRELATMLGAGQDLDRALRFIVETAPSVRVSTIIDRMRNKVRGGGTLSVALAQEPRSFTKLYVGLVRAGEAGGTLAETLERLATLLERERSLAATIQSALLYPAILVVAAIGSIVLLLTEVLPEFTPLFEQSGAQIPTPTRVLMALGTFVSTAGPWLLVLFLLAILATQRALKRPAVHLRWDRFLLRLPVLGGLTREILAARFCRTLGTLLRNGVPLVSALGIVKEAQENLVALAAIDHATDAVRSGRGLAQPLAESQIFPVRTTHLLRLGEETAQLAPMALRAAEIHEENTRLNTQRLVALIVPVITILIGAAVAGIVGSLLVAMLSLNDLAN